jgi:hypothetical protein
VLALGAQRSSDQVFVYETAHHVALPSGEGVLCEEGDYSGFSTVSDATMPLTGWRPGANAVEPTVTTVAASTLQLPGSKVEACIRP